MSKEVKSDRERRGGNVALSLAFAKEFRCSTGGEMRERERDLEGGGDVCFDVLSKT